MREGRSTKEKKRRREVKKRLDMILSRGFEVNNGIKNVEWW